MRTSRGAHHHDHRGLPGTALAIAREIGLDHRAGCITGPELGAMTDNELARRVRSVSVFARMIPEQKLQLVRALKANGESSR